MDLKRSHFAVKGTAHKDLRAQFGVFFSVAMLYHYHLYIAILAVLQQRQLLK